MSFSFRFCVCESVFFVWQLCAASFVEIYSVVFGVMFDKTMQDSDRGYFLLQSWLNVAHTALNNNEASVTPTFLTNEVCKRCHLYIAALYLLKQKKMTSRKWENKKNVNDKDEMKKWKKNPCELSTHVWLWVYSRLSINFVSWCSQVHTPIHSRNENMWREYNIWRTTYNFLQQNPESSASSMFRQQWCAHCLDISYSI